MPDNPQVSDREVIEYLATRVMGWKRCGCRLEGWLIRDTGMTTECVHGWNPLDFDKDAMEMQRAIPEEDRDTYSDELLRICQSDHCRRTHRPCAYNLAAFATSRQRSMAAYRAGRVA